MYGNSKVSRNYWGGSCPPCAYEMYDKKYACYNSYIFLNERYKRFLHSKIYQLQNSKQKNVFWYFMLDKYKKVF